MILPRAEDSVRDYPGAGLTPSRLAAILREADDGSLSTAMQLFEEMEEKDSHLFAVANTRRLALTGPPWQVVSAADVQDGVDRSHAEEVTRYCREVLEGLERFDEVLQHLSLAIGRNIAIAEIVWGVARGELRPVDVTPVDFTRIAFDELDRPRILTRDGPEEGIELPPNKFIVHTPHSVSGHPQRGGLLRVTAMAYLAKNLALKDWMIFAEVFGMPVRIARYEPNATPDEKRELLDMLESLGANAAGIFSRAVELQVIEANRGTVGPPYERLAEFLNREMSKAWLGQTLTTDVAGQKGSYAASTVHELVRQDVLADDARKEGRTIRRDLLTPLTRLRFGPDAPVPHFCRKATHALGPAELAGVMDAAVNRLGVKVPLGWAHEALGIPQVGDAEKTVPGAASRSLE
jgi:phage gp29-like protein